MLHVLIYASTVGRQKSRLKLLKKMTTWSRSMKPSTGISGRCLIKDSSGTRTLQSVEERVPERSRLSFSCSKTRARWTSLRTRFRMTLYLVSVLLDRRRRVAHSLPSAKDVSPDIEDTLRSTIAFTPRLAQASRCSRCPCHY